MRSTFQIEDPLSTSSIAIALTNMDALVEDRVTVYHPNSATGQILSQTYGELFKAVEQELNVFMSLAHLKIVYAPALPYPTLSKWGIIFLGTEMAQIESNVLYSVELRSIQKEIARSVYQLFLGEMITPEWWDSQWVTRGLATYLSAVSKHLPFDGEKEFLIDSVHRVIREDHNTNTWLKQNITYGKHINDPNLLVVQHKGEYKRHLLLSEILISLPLLSWSHNADDSQHNGGGQILRSSPRLHRKQSVPGHRFFKVWSASRLLLP